MVEWKLSVDLDRVPYWKLLMVYFNMKYFYGDVEVYRTENGWHLIANVPTSVEGRLLLCDDGRRLFLSEVRESASGVLDDVTFEWKFDGRKWRKRDRVDEKSLLADEFWKPYGRPRRWSK